MLKDLIPMVALHGKHTETQLSDFKSKWVAERVTREILPRVCVQIDRVCAEQNAKRVRWKHHWIWWELHQWQWHSKPLETILRGIYCLLYWHDSQKGWNLEMICPGKTFRLIWEDPPIIKLSSVLQKQANLLRHSIVQLVTPHFIAILNIIQNILTLLCHTHYEIELQKYGL